MEKTRLRWGDNDKNFGPFTYAYNPKGWRPISIVLGSGGEENPGCRIRFSAFGRTLIVYLPPIIRPHRVKVFPNWDIATIERLGRDWYFDVTEREYGFSCSEGFLNVFLGRQSHDSSTEQRWSCFLPWTQWRFVRYSLYDLDGVHVWTEPARRKGLTAEERSQLWDEEMRQKDLVPKMHFKLLDFDGEEIIATTFIEEREWRFGEKWCSWLSWFRRPKIVRSLDIRYDKEVGKRKGSWKGGTIGTGIELILYADGIYEGPMGAILRHCRKNNMKFAGIVEKPKHQPTENDNEENRPGSSVTLDERTRTRNGVDG